MGLHLKARSDTFYVAVIVFRLQSDVVKIKRNNAYYLLSGTSK